MNQGTFLSRWKMGKLRSWLPRWAPARALEQDDFSSNRHPALALCLSMSFFAKPVPTFAGHALAERCIRPLRAKTRSRLGRPYVSFPRLRTGRRKCLQPLGAHSTQADVSRARLGQCWRTHREDCPVVARWELGMSLHRQRKDATPAPYRRNRPFLCRSGEPRRGRIDRRLASPGELTNAP
jgi:hypothetical protein